MKENATDFWGLRAIAAENLLKSTVLRANRCALPATFPRGTSMKTASIDR